MQTRTKQRLVGLLILLAILAIFIPLVFHNARPSTEMQSVKIPPKPKINVSLNNLEQKEAAQLKTNSIQTDVRDSGASSTQNRAQVHPIALTNSSMTEEEKSPSVTTLAIDQTEQIAESKSVDMQKEHQKKDKAQTVSEQRGLSKFMAEPKAWCVQLGTFRNVNNANLLIKKLRKKGYDAYTRPILDKDGKHLLRVYVGPEIRKESAIQLKNELKMSVHLNGVVMKYKVKT